MSSIKKCLIFKIATLPLTKLLSIILPIVSLILPSIAVSSVPNNIAHCDWSGMYIGGFAGGSTGTRIYNTEPIRLDNNAYWFRPFNNSYRYKTKGSFIGGITIGYSLQLCNSPFLIGIEGEYGYLNLRGSKTDPNQFLYASLPNNNLINDSHNVVHIGKSSGYGFIGARIIYALDTLVQDDIMLYAKVGTILTKIKSKYDSVKTEDLAPAFLNLAGKGNITGFGVGGGVEFNLPCELLANTSAKIEYLLLRMNKSKYVYGHCSCHFLWRMNQHIRNANTIKVGLNYKFM